MEIHEEIKGYLEDLVKELKIHGIGAVYTTSPMFTDEQNVEWYDHNEFFHTISYWTDEAEGVYFVMKNGTTHHIEEFDTRRFIKNFLKWHTAGLEVKHLEEGKNE